MQHPAYNGIDRITQGSSKPSTPTIARFQEKDDRRIKIRPLSSAIRSNRIGYFLITPSSLFRATFLECTGVSSKVQKLRGLQAEPRMWNPPQ